MLSETPANNQFIDLRNQLALARKIIIKKNELNLIFNQNRKVQLKFHETI